jgi:SAM-dependent methyltransferase
MSGWNEGYVTDVPYTANIYREFTPNWLATASLLLGQRPPDLTRPFRMAELGCGHGLTLAAAAAASPEATFWGFDLNPAHIESARRFADAAGLANLHFEERSFAALAALPDAALPQFDIIALHGVWSWIGPQARAEAVAFIAQRLAPGGLLYVSYNVGTGWAGMVPVRNLMRLLARGALRSDLAVAPALAFIERLREGGAAYFAANPTIEQRLKTVQGLDPRYVAHEYLNAHWQPLSFAEMAASMDEARCTYVGSATFTDNIDAASVPAGVLPILAEQRDPVLRETVRDMGSGQGFRRDIYRRGLAPLAAGEHMDLLHAMALVPLGLKRGEEIHFASAIGQVTGRPEIYDPLLAMLDRSLAEPGGAVTLRAVRDAPAFADKPVSEPMQAVALLISGGHAHPVLPGGAGEAALAAAARANAVIAQSNLGGTPIGNLIAPRIGGAVPADPLEAMVVGAVMGVADGGAHGAAPDAAALTPRIADALTRLGRTMQRDGKALTDPAEHRAAVGAAVHAVLTDRLPVHRALGIRT